MRFSRAEALLFLQQLIRIDTVEGAPSAKNAPFGEGNRKALDLVLARLSTLGYRVKDVDGYAGFAEKGDGALFGILGHLDVVPADGVWTHPPFAAEIADGILYGRGVLDDKGPMVAAIAALEELFDEGNVLTRRVRLIFGCNEESGWRCMDRYAATEEMPEEGISPDGDFPVIYAEKGVAYYEIEVAKPKILRAFRAGSRPNIVPDRAEATVDYFEECALRAHGAGIETERDGDRLRLVAHGRAAHGSRPADGDNAIVKLLGFLGCFDSGCAALSEAFTLSNGANLGLKMSDKTSGALTLNLGVADVSDNRIRLKIDIRHPVSVKRETVTNILNAVPAFKVTPKAYHDPLYVDPADPLIKKLSEAYAAVTGRDATPVAIGGATYARVLKKGVAFGPAEAGEPDPIHAPDECIALARFDRMIDIYKEAFRRLVF